MRDRGPVSASSEPGVEFRLGGVLGAGAASAVLFGVAAFIPVLAPLSLVSPLPLAVQRLRGGAGSAWLAAVLATALVAAARSPEPAVYFLFTQALPGLLLGESLARGRGLLRGCGWAFGLLVVEITVALVFAANEIARHTLAPFEQLTSEAFQQQLRAGGMSPDGIADLVESFRRLHDVMAVVFPAAWIIAAGVVVMVNAALLRLYLLRADPGWLEDGEFERVRFPLALVAAFILAGAAVALPLARPAAYNVLLLVAFFFALQGLAVAAFYARRLAAPPFLRVALLVLVLANPWAPYILALLGLFDNWFDFRRFAEPPPRRGEGPERPGGRD
jgi:uncharacterized protein YybS (DUF2232 family)